MRKTKTLSERKAAEAEIKLRYESLRGTLTERSRRLFAGSEAWPLATAALRQSTGPPASRPRWSGVG